MQSCCGDHAEVVRQMMQEMYPGFDLTPVCSQKCCRGCRMKECYYRCKNECERNEDMAKKKEVTEVATAPATTMVDENRSYIRAALLNTRRDGVEDLLDKMNEMGFYTAPASGGNHLHMEGGLAQHSINVARAAEKVG